MQATYKIKEPDEVEATLTINATVKELRFLRAHTEAVYGTSEFRAMLAEVIDDAEKVFYAQTDT